MGYSTGTLSATFNATSPRQHTDGDSSAGFVNKGRDMRSPRTMARSPRASGNSSGIASPGSKHRSIYSSVTSLSACSRASLSCASSGGGRELWLTGDVAQVGRLGNMRESLKQDAINRREASLEASRQAIEYEKARRKEKYEAKLSRQEAFQEKLKVLRDHSAEAKKREYWLRERERELSRERVVLEEQIQALKPAIRLEKVERKAEKKISQSMQLQAEREKRLDLARIALERQQEIHQRSVERQEAQTQQRYEVRHEQLQQQEAARKELKHGNIEWKELNALRSKRELAERQARVQEERFQVEIVQHRKVQQRVEKVAAEQKKYEVVRNTVKDRRDIVRHVSRIAVDRIRVEQRLLKEKEQAEWDERRTRTLEARERLREVQHLRHQQRVELRSVKSARSHDEYWKQQRPKTWGTRDLSLDRSDGDTSLRTLALVQRAVREPRPESSRSC